MTTAPTRRGTGAAPEMESAVWRVLEPGLHARPSALDATVVTWTAETAKDLRERITSGDEGGSGSFVAKLRRQLDGAPRPVVVLAAELLYVQVAPLSNLKPATKRGRIGAVLSWLSPPATLPAELDVGLSAHGAFHGGVGFNVQIWQQLVWLCRFVEHWAEESDEVRAEALSDPWKFRDVAVATGLATGSDWPSIRFCLEYLVWPGTFPNVVNSDHRRSIRDALANSIGGPSSKTAITEDLVKIREKLERDRGGFVDFYQPPYGPMWVADKDQGQRAWLLRPNSGGPELAKRWLRERFVSLDARHLGDLSPGADLKLVASAVEAGYRHLDYAQRITLAAEYHAFLSKMKPDDLVACVLNDAMHLGVVDGEAEYVNDKASRLRRTIAWSSNSVQRSALLSPLPALLDAQGTVVDLTVGLDVLSTYVATEDALDEEPIGTQPVVVPDVVPQLGRVTDAVADALYMGRGELQEIVDLLHSRQQIVLYGPPGTGKTFLAKTLAQHLVGSDDSSRAQLVQFHPSYSYEDFFEGYRPTLDGGQATFKLLPGPLRLLASVAVENPGQPFVLIIDELNRANLAKVFGELYFLLEYRDESVLLQYNAHEVFRLPKNLFIIATMNTSDRSIAMVDAAIRRRFAFVELHPDEPPVRDVLAAFVDRNHKSDERVALLHALNDAIDENDRDLRIGPSYLMRPDVDLPGGLERVWKYDLLPLLEEHYYGRLRPSDIEARFGLAALRTSIEPAPDSDPGAAGGSEETETSPS